MTRNAILDELHAARRKILADYNGDTAAYLRDAQARLEASGRPIATPQAANNPMHRSGEVRRIGNGESIVAAR